jgi:hypothetical protein
LTDAQIDRPLGRIDAIGRGEKLGLQPRSRVCAQVFVTTSVGQAM